MSLEVAAKRSVVKAEQLASWEAGTARPTIPQLRKLALVYRRPLAAFYLPEAPTRFEVMHDFRRLSNETLSVENSPKLAFEIRRAYDRREWALELMEDVGESCPAFSASATLHEGVEEVGKRLREAIGARVSKQGARRTDTDVFKYWRSLLETAGVLTLQATSLQLSEARGFSISLRPLPVIVANIKDAPKGRVFTLLHEATHVMLNDGGICDLHDGDTEAFCNRVAGATLFPREALLNSPTVKRHNVGDEAWTDAELQELSRSFGGSREAALVRLLTLKLTTQRFYDRMRNVFLKSYEDQQKRRLEAESFPPPHVIAISSAGPLFTALVLENFVRDKITASDVSDYLQIRLKHLKELQSEFSKRA